MRSRRAKEDERLSLEIVRFQKKNFGVHGDKKFWPWLDRADFKIERDRVARIMAGLGWKASTAAKR